MAKAKAKAKEQTRAQASRVAHTPDPERLNRVLLLGIVGAVVLAAIGFIGFGWYQTKVRPFSKTVLRVEDTKFDLAHLQRRMQNAVDNGTPLTQANFTSFPGQILDQLQLEASLLASVDELGIEVTEEDIDAEIRDIGNLADDVSARAYAEEYRRQVDESGLTQREYRQMLAGSIATDRAYNYFTYVAPAQEPQVRWRWIVVDTAEEADAAKVRLDAGEDFDTVATEVSVPGTRPGEVTEDWTPRGYFPDAAIEAFLFDNGEPGESSGVINTHTFSYIVELVERDENRTLESTQRRIVANRELSAWIDGLELDIDRNLTDEDAVRALNKLHL